MVAAFPLDSSPYTRLFYSSLERHGCSVVRGEFYGRWLLENLGGVDYCHFHWPSFLYHDKHGPPLVRLVRFARFVALMLLIRLRGVRIAWTAHNLYPHDGGKQQLLHRVARHLMVWLSDVIFVHGPTPLEIFAAEFPRARGKLWPIRHGHYIGYYPDATDRREARQKLGLPDEAFICLFLGICKEYKNLETLIEALSQTQPDTLLVISGEFQSAEYYQKIRQMAEPMAGRVVFHPEFVPDEELQYHFAACDVVVLPYKEVLTSGTVLLAMSFGKPIIACGQGSILDVLSPEVGIAFSPNTPEALASAIARARVMQFRSETIREHARHFDWERSAEAAAEVLRSRCQTEALNPR